MELKDLIVEQFLGFNVTKELADPDLAMFYAGLQHREIWLDNDVEWGTCSFIVRYINYLNSVEGDNMEPIKLHIMSCGGDLSVMFCLYHTIRRSKIPVWTYNEGQCHSAAVLIFLAGDERFMHDDALFIAHQGSSMMAGNYRENKSMMKQYDKEIARMKSLICDRTGISLEYLDEQFEKDQDFYIDHDLAKELHFITKELNEE